MTAANRYTGVKSLPKGNYTYLVLYEQTITSIDGGCANLLATIIQYSEKR